MLFTIVHLDRGVLHGEILPSLLRLQQHHDHLDAQHRQRRARYQLNYYTIDPEVDILESVAHRRVELHKVQRGVEHVFLLVEHREVSLDRAVR